MKPHAKTSDSMTAASPLQHLYVQDLGTTPLIDRETEVALATQLTAARLAIQKIALGLPESCRSVVLAEGTSDSALAATWRLSFLEAFICKLVHFTGQHQDTKAVAALREIRAHKHSPRSARSGLTSTRWMTRGTASFAPTCALSCTSRKNMRTEDCP